MFDKTGTLTHGRPTVASVCAFAEEKAAPLARIVAAVGVAESGSADKNILNQIFIFMKELFQFLHKQKKNPRLLDYKPIKKSQKQKY